MAPLTGVGWPTVALQLSGDMKCTVLIKSVWFQAIVNVRPLEKKKGGGVEPRVSNPILFLNYIYW